MWVLCIPITVSICPVPSANVLMGSGLDDLLLAPLALILDAGRIQGPFGVITFEKNVEKSAEELKMMLTGKRKGKDK